MDMVETFFKKSDRWKLNYGRRAKMYFSISAWTIGLLKIFLGYVFNIKKYQMLEVNPPLSGWIDGTLKGDLHNKSTLFDKPTRVSGDIINDGFITLVAAVRTLFNFGTITQVVGDSLNILQWGASDEIKTNGNVMIFATGSVKRIRCKNLFVWGWTPAKGILDVEVENMVFLMDCQGEVTGKYGKYFYVYFSPKSPGIKKLELSELLTKEEWEKRAKAKAAALQTQPASVPVPATSAAPATPAVQFAPPFQTTPATPAATGATKLPKKVRAKKPAAKKVPATQAAPKVVKSAPKKATTQPSNPKAAPAAGTHALTLRDPSKVPNSRRAQ